LDVGHAASTLAAAACAIGEAAAKCSARLAFRALYIFAKGAIDARLITPALPGMPLKPVHHIGIQA
jgi:hypothetical protein